MFPYIDLFGNILSTYSVLGVAALVIATAVAALRAKRHNLDANDLILAVLFAGVGLVAGGMLLFAIVQLAQGLRPFGGMVFYGGLFGALALLCLYAKVQRKNLADVIAVTVPVLPLAHGIMRLGCFAAGCCFGVPHDTLGIAFTNSVVAPNGIPLLPVQLYETALNFVIFIGLWLFSRKKRQATSLLGVYALSYAAGRFALEFLRGDVHRGFVLGVSTSQFISILVAVACVVMLLIRKSKTAATIRR